MYFFMYSVESFFKIETTMNKFNADWAIGFGNLNSCSFKLLFLL